ncbi:hypothetical protein LINGRAHAP2_LOCUS21075 [Linum grandiflorum]
MAKDVLAISVSTVASEPAFSTRGHAFWMYFGVH